MRPLRPILATSGNWVKTSFDSLRKKGFYYWARVAMLIATGIWIGDLIEERRILVGPRYWIYHTLQRASVRVPSHYSNTVVVLIGDEEYWKGELARRTPLKRTYLAKLLSNLSLGNPCVIALDVDLSSQTPDQSVIEHPDYCDETYELLKTVDRISRDRPVVLPKTLVSQVENDEPTLLTFDKPEFTPEPSVSDFYAFDPRAKANVYRGYVSLPYDIRQVPLDLRMKDGPPLPSFAVAIVRAMNRDVYSPRGDTLPYGIFVSPRGPDVLSAKDVLEMSSETLKSRVQNKVVLIGGAWHEHAFGRGNQVDTHLTPLGDIGGVFVHANYVEALLSNWTSRPLGKRLAVTIDVLLSILIAVVFAWEMSPGKKLASVAVLSVALIGVTYFFWQNLGLFFDFSIPLILLSGHTVFEKVLEWRSKANAKA